MIELRKLNHFTMDDELSFGLNGYISLYKYIVSVENNPSLTEINLRLEKLEKPYKKVWPKYPDDIELYNSVIPQGNSFGAYLDEQLVGVVIVSYREWNNTFWIENIEIAENHRGKGIGSMLLKKVEDKAKLKKVRIIGLETQNTNYPAISFYRKNDYTVDGLDVSYYTNHYLTSEIALFMKKKITE